MIHRPISSIIYLCLFSLYLVVQVCIGSSLEESVKHGYADSDGVQIHYASLGKGPLVVMIHGFPDFWYTWRDQMEALADDFHVVAIDMRGYNKSDKPKGVENYDMSLLVQDVVAVVRHFKKEKAIIVGHDWGGAVAWTFAMSHPQMTERLIVLNLPHLRGLNRELATNPQQQKNSQYARDFQKEDAHLKLTPENLSSWVKDPQARKKYIEAFQRSDFEALLNYYKRNYPKEPYTLDTSPIIKVQCSVLLIHGLDDWALLHPALNGTWEWLESDLTLVTIPNAGHFVQQDASTLVTKTMRMWLKR